MSTFTDYPDCFTERFLRVLRRQINRFHDDYSTMIGKQQQRSIARMGIIHLGRQPVTCRCHWPIRAQRQQQPWVKAKGWHTCARLAKHDVTGRPLGERLNSVTEFTEVTNTAGFSCMNEHRRLPESSQHSSRNSFFFTEVVKQLHQLPIEWQFRFKLASVTCKQFKHISHPPYLADLLQCHKHTRSTRSWNGKQVSGRWTVSQLRPDSLESLLRLWRYVNRLFTYCTIKLTSGGSRRFG